MKIAGRDAGRKCVIVDVLDKKFVLIDGGTRRRKCNASHIEPLDQVIDLRKGASHETVSKAFKELKLPVWDTKKKETKPRQVKKRKARTAAAAQKKKVVKKVAKPAEKKAETNSVKASAAKTVQ